MRDIRDLNLQELEELLLSWKENKFHARQIFAWIYQKGVQDFSRMSDLSAGLRKMLSDNFVCGSLKLADKVTSADGTEKFLFELKDKNYIEAVNIPAYERVTACISTQAGCKFSCAFCASGLPGFKRNLTCGEILEEFAYLKDQASGGKITNLVFMGTGEPFDNYDNVLKAIRVINADYAFYLGARHITISTCGIIPGIEKLSKEGLQIELSVSLHAGDDKKRSAIMPVNKKYPLRDLIEACRKYSEATKRQVTFEYLLIKGKNSALLDAQNLSSMLKGFRLAKVNLIPANPVKECAIEPPERKDVLTFRDYLLKSGINVTLRRSRGEDIQAACGQLRLKYEKK